MDYDVFISYSRKDTAIADRVCAAFDRAGITYFIDRQGIGGAVEFPDEIARAIKGCRKMLFLASRNAYASKYTKREIFFAFNEKNDSDIIPYVLDGCDMPDSLRFVFSTTNIRNMREHPVETVLVDDILRLLGRKIEKSDEPTPEPSERRFRFELSAGQLLKKIKIAVAFLFVALLAILVFDRYDYIFRGKNDLSLSDADAIAIEQQPNRDISSTAGTSAVQHSDTQTKRSGGQPKQAAPAAATPAATPATTAAASANTANAASAAEERPAVKTYKVGDYYNENGREGVVFEVDATGRHGKIVGMKQAKLQWFTSEEYEKKVAIGATDKTDGMKNMQTIMRIAGWRDKYPAFAWCAGQGDGWYLPAIEELKKFTLDDSTHDAVNRTLSQHGGVALFNKGDRAKWYRSSSEESKWCAWYVDMGNGGTFGNLKYDYYFVRAVSAF